MRDKRHIPVLLREVLESFQPLKDAYIIDGTFGAGGYSRAFLEAGASVLAVDRDPEAIAEGQSLVTMYPERFTLHHTRFSQIEQFVHHPISGIILDIGVSSMQIDEAERGFSFRKDGPLDMRMEQYGVCAADIVNTASAKDLSRIFYCLGEERHANKIAFMIERRRKTKPFLRTLDLAEAVESCIGRFGKQKIHPATRVFQALRIYINDELGELYKLLLLAEKLLPAGGRLGIVTFHSLEDRLVKQFFCQRSQAPAVSRHLPILEASSASFKLLFKGYKGATETEIKENPRARSAKLRVAVRTEAPVKIIQGKNTDLAYFPRLGEK